MSRTYVERRRDPNDYVGTWVANSTSGGDAIALSGTIKYGSGKHGVEFRLDREWLNAYVRAREACSQTLESPGHAVWHMDSQKFEPCSGATRVGRMPTMPVDEVLDSGFYAWASGPGEPAMTTPELREALMACWQAARWALIKSLGDLTLKELDALRAEARRHP